MKRLGFVICIMLLVVAFVVVSGHVLRPLDTDEAVKSIKTFHSLPADSLEVIIYGSSHAWRGIDTPELYNKYGIAAYNYGCNWQRFNITQLFVKDSLRKQTPKVAVIETARIAMLLFNVDVEGEVFYSRALPMSSAKIDYMKQCFGYDIPHYITYFFPLYLLHSNWENVNAKNFKLNTCSYDFIAAKGFNPYRGVNSVIIGDYIYGEQKDFPPAVHEILNDILEECSSLGTKIVFVTLPYQGMPFEYFDAIQRYADENDCCYINYFDVMKETGINPETDFFDPEHLNAEGARKAADYLGRYLKEHFDLQDVRKDADNVWIYE